MAAHLWKPATQQAFDEAYAAAESIENLALRLGCSNGALHRYCRDHGIDLDPIGVRGVRAMGKRPSLSVNDELRGASLDDELNQHRARAERQQLEQRHKDAIARLKLYEEVEQTLAERYADPLPAPSFQSLPKSASSRRLPLRTAVLQISDWQIGELVRASDTGGLNEYNWQVFERRFERWLGGVIGSLELQMHVYRVEELVIALGGDMVEGHDVYSGQAWHLERDAARQVIDGAPVFAAGIRRIVEVMRKRVPRICVYCVPGNHGKPGGRKGGAVPSSLSFDLLLYEFLRVMLRDCALDEFAVEEAGRLLFMAAGNVCLMTHGNEVRGWGGFPFYGLDKAQGRLASEMDTLFHFWLLGHWHQSATLPAGRGMRIVNGNAVGANQLTTAAVMGATLPSQNLLYFSREFGLAEQAYIALAPDEFVRPHIYGRQDP